MGAMTEFADQAAGLRRLFAHRALRVLPVLVPDSRCETRSAWLAKLAEAFAREGSRTLAIDAARVQVAATLGLRARYDLLHALRGECTIDAVLLDAAPGLTVLPATRAFEHAAQMRTGLADVLAACGPIDGRYDIVLLLLPAAQARLLPAGSVLVPVQPNRTDVSAVLNDLRRAGELADNVEFRLLFLGIEEAAAYTLSERMSGSARGWSNAGVSFGGAAWAARDLGRIVRTAWTWNLTQMKLEMESCH